MGRRQKTIHVTIKSDDCAALIECCHEAVTIGGLPSKVWAAPTRPLTEPRRSGRVGMAGLGPPGFDPSRKGFDTLRRGHSVPRALSHPRWIRTAAGQKRAEA